MQLSKAMIDSRCKPNEINAFIAILICSGYVDLPRRRMFWEQASDVHNELVCSLMSPDRFEEVMKYIHFNDNTQLDPEDRYSEVRPLMDHLNMKFVDIFCGEEELDVDESMVPFMDAMDASSSYGISQSVLVTKSGV